MQSNWTLHYTEIQVAVNLRVSLSSELNCLKQFRCVITPRLLRGEATANPSHLPYASRPLLILRSTSNIITGVDNLTQSTPKRVYITCLLYTSRCV